MQQSKSHKILTICTSNFDRSPSLERYFRENYPHHEYKSCGINRYFTSKKGTTYMSKEFVKWASLIICAEDIHVSILCKEFKAVLMFLETDYWKIIMPNEEGNFIDYGENNKKLLVLNCGDYKRGKMEEYIIAAEHKIKCCTSIFNP